ncbi:MAG: sulfate adenylyltransferase small subunit, partial [Patescibacteria group bacterium]|nr:sulfate adenylyltransferase small subunit [Patescibacteria group bacterium]
PLPTGAVLSPARNVKEIIEELKQTRVSERQTRAIDHSSDTAMEEKKKEGYF